MGDDEAERFRAAMIQHSDWWLIEHVDITCDLCEIEPIVGHRYKCTVCDDLDICESCYLMEIENGKKGGALHADGQHGFEDMEGPERAVRFLLPPSGMVTGLEEQALEMLNKYLREFRPSHASCEHVAWICVSFCPTLDVGDDAVEQVQQHAGAGDKQEREGWSLEDRIDGLLETFEALEGMCPGVIESRDHMTASRIDELAKDFNVLRGKWMCFPHTDQVDSVWETLAHALASNDLAPVSEIKVAPRTPGQKDHAVCIYTDNYLDREEMLRVRDLLREMLPDSRLLYKPDIYTILGIYRGNKWGISASIMVDDPHK